MRGMNPIALLSQETIDQIAAGEVVERPSSVVKELVENAIDAGANAVTVEIREGGTALIRVTDNGCGIPKEEVRAAFLRHATSKIRTVDDLPLSGTLGFRGEALSSIAAVAQVEMITKTPESLLGVRYVIEGGAEQTLEEVGAPEGTTFLVRNLFYNTPARRKFLKSAAAEAGYISDLMDRLALSHPDISFKYMNHRDIRMHTSGNGKMKDIIYGIYGREVTSNLLEIRAEKGPVGISGYIGKPVISRGNRNYENYFVNGRYVKSAVISRAIEDACQPFLMKHHFPFTVLMLTVDPEQVDINVHPTKMEVRFADQSGIYDCVYQIIKEGIVQRELVPEVKKEETAAHRAEQERKRDAPSAPSSYPEPFEKVRVKVLAESESPYEPEYPDPPSQCPPGSSSAGQAGEQDVLPVISASGGKAGALKPVTGMVVLAENPADPGAVPAGDAVSSEKEAAGKAVQMELFEDRPLQEQQGKRYKLIGQVFDTYWIVEYEDRLYIIDQHAAHEKVLYERMMHALEQKKQTSQMITPPLIVSLSLQEEQMLKKHLDSFTEIGFEIEPFGGKEYAVSAVPGELYGIADVTLFLEILDGLTDIPEQARNQAVREKLASMSCKAAVKGNHPLTEAEVEALITELLSLENPYNCPHGRPTMISMSKYELEKNFKRVL